MQRYLFEYINKLSLDRRKMAFISGPRQVGKTTLSKDLGTNYDQFIYKNWDEVLFRRQWLKNPKSILELIDLADNSIQRLLVLDEIHKSKNWKTKVKGLYDELSDDIKIIVNGSARLNVFKKGGDSLMGRYLNFRLHPLSYGELAETRIMTPEQWKKNLFVKPTESKNKKEILLNLLKYSGFPEPYFAKNENIANIWRSSRHEKIVREDLRDISRILELSQVEMLAALLPTKVGSPLSIQSLREDLETSFDTVKRWLRYLEELYFYFEIKPWSKSIARAIRKEPKIYLYDWTECENEPAKFENLIASHLLKACHFWNDTGEGKFELHYVRNKEKKEIDFLISNKNKPWLLVETKMSETFIDTKTAKGFSASLNCPYVQVIFNERIWFYKNELLLIDAEIFLRGLP